MKPNTEWNLPGGELTSLHSEIKRIYCKPNWWHFHGLESVVCVCHIIHSNYKYEKKKTSSRGEELSVRYNVTVCFCVSFFLWCRISEEHGASVWTRCLVFLETQISFFYRLYFLFRRKPPLPPPPPHPPLSDRMCECVRACGTMSRSLTIM